MFGVFLLVLFSVIHKTEGQGLPIFIGLEAFSPPYIFCTSNSPGQCTPFRSSGCNLDTFRCTLTDFTPENSSIPLVDFISPITYGEYYPGAQDGKISFTARFVPGVLSAGIRIFGFFQLWREEDNRQNVYRFTGRQEYVDLSDLPPAVDTVDIIFHELRAGGYRIIYWDIGGSRLGSGVPEISPEYSLGTVLPMNMHIRAEVIERTLSGPDIYTNIFRGNRNYISHHLVGDSGFEMWLINAPNHNRKVMWEHRSDQGNVINVGERTPFVPPSTIVLNDPSRFPDPFFFRHFPMMCGRRCLKRTLIQARLVYVGLPNSQYSDYFEDRQRYGYGTVIGRRVMALNRRRFDEGTRNSLIIDPVTGATITSFGDVDTYDFPTWMRVSGLPTRGTGIINGETIVMDDFYTDDEFQGSEGVIEGQTYRLEADFVTHTNFEVGNDYACRPIATNYARGVNQEGDYKDWFRRTYCGNDEFVNLDNGRRDNHMFLDIDWRRDYMRLFFRGTENWNLPNECSRACPVSGIGPNACPCNVIYPTPLTDCPNLCGTGRDSTDRIEYFGTSARSLRDWMTVQQEIGEIIPDDSSGCNIFERTGNGIGCVRGYSPGYREDIQVMGFNVKGMEGSGYADVDVDTNRISPLLDQVVCYEGADQQLQMDTAGSDKNWFAHFKQTSGQEVPTDQTPFEFQLNDNFWGSVGPDSWVATVKTRLGPNNPKWRERDGDTRIYIDVAAAGYARFKVIPTIQFLQFESFDIGDPLISGDEFIDVRFRIQCPFLDHGVFPSVDARNTGWCMDKWRIRTAGNVEVLDKVKIGYKRQMVPLNTESGLFDDDLGEVLDDLLFLIRVKYIENEDLVIYFFPRLEPELERVGVVGNPTGAECSGGRFVVPLRRMPPIEHVWNPLSSAARVAPPACEYNSPEILTATFKGEPFVFASVLNRDLPDVVGLGNEIDRPRHIDYYEYWRIGGEIIQGFSEEFQLFEEGAQVTIYDRKDAVYIDNIPTVQLPPLFPNPLARPPRCISNENATCPVNFEDSDMFSGINQFHRCTVVGSSDTLLEPRLVFVPPFRQVDNVGAFFFNETTEFIDVFIDEQRYKGIFQMDEGFTVETTGFYTLTVRYGRTIAGLLEAPCFERLIDLIIVLSPFQPDPGAIQRDPGCTDPNNCCYFIDITVRGNTPNNADVVDLDTCFNDFDACKYEIITDPAPTSGLLCLGQTYEFTVQSPELLVQNRSGPKGLPFLEPTPWRCPATFTLTLPVASLSPIEYLVLPGPCSNPGAVVEFTLRYTQPECDGFVNSDNAQESCRLDVLFALQHLNTLQFVANASVTNPFKITGQNSLIYNAESKFIFPDFFSDPGATLIDGQWRVWVWVVPAGSSGVEPSEVADPRDSVTTTFVASQENSAGLSVLRTNLFRPLCPQTEGIITEGAIVIDFIVQDLRFDGPYTIQFLSPTDKLLLIDAGGAPCDENSRTCNITSDFFCSGICPDTDPVCDGCDQRIRIEGIPVRAYIGTGIHSIRESGLYRLVARAIESTCNATYGEVVNQLDSLIAEIHCYDAHCASGQRTRTGIVETDVSGGTKNPFFERPLVQGRFNEVYKLLYTYTWSTPEGIENIPFLTNVGQGTYTLNASDYHNCTAPPVSCVVGTFSPPMQLELVSSTAANCSDSPSELVFRVTAGTPPYTLLKIGPSQSPVDEGVSVILSDNTVIPGSQFTYTVVDALQCTSPFVNFSLDPSTTLGVSIEVVAYPCVAGQNSGVLRAVLTGGGAADEIKWFDSSNNEVGGGLILSGRVADTYTVTVNNLLGCSATATAVLTTAPPITIVTDRTDVLTDPGTVFVTVLGGNDKPYDLEVIPLDNIVIEELTGTPFIAEFRLNFVPVQWSGLVRVTDPEGCVKQEGVVGPRVPVDIPFETPTPLPDLPTAIKKVDTGLHPGWAWLIFGYMSAALLFWAILALIWPKEPVREQEEIEKKET